MYRAAKHALPPILKQIKIQFTILEKLDSTFPQRHQISNIIFALVATRVGFVRASGISGRAPIFFFTTTTSTICAIRN